MGRSSKKLENSEENSKNDPFQVVRDRMKELTWEEMIMFPLDHLVYKGMCTHTELNTFISLPEAVRLFKVLNIETAILEAIVKSIMDSISKGISKQ